MDGGTTESAGGGRGTVVEGLGGLGGLEGWWNASGIAIWSFVLFGAFLLNATLLLAFLKRPGLRTISNRFVMNLTVSNLLTCAMLNPLLMLDGRSPPGSSSAITTCTIAEGATALVTTSSILAVLLIAVDQYLAVVDPLRYRTRIDKLKCGILIVSVWLVSVMFGLIAVFNPHPRSLWLSCRESRLSTVDESPNQNFTQNSSMDLTLDENFRLVVNTSEDYAREGEFSFTEFDEDVSLFENSTAIVRETIVENSISRENFTSDVFDDPTTTYGLVYAVVYTLIAYLLPFVGVCWIYVSIYSAAHKNSERTRRTGSRPILSSGSFSEEYCPVRQDVSTEDFRRIPKISSLSSIDESIETLTPSQIMPRRGSEFANSSFNNNHQNTIDEEEPSGVVFTVGSRKVDVTPQQRPKSSSSDARTNDDDDDTKDRKTRDNKVPTSVLRAQFLGNNDVARPADDLVRSKFRDEPNQKRKSSHDLMYEEMLRRDLEKLRIRHASSMDESSEEDEEEDEEDDEEAEAKTSGCRDVETGAEERVEPTERIPRDSFVVDDEEADRKDQKDQNSSRSEPDKNMEQSSRKNSLDTSQNLEQSSRKNSLVTSQNLEQSSRKNSLDDSDHRLQSQSSILKSQQHFCCLNGKSYNRGSQALHRTDLPQSTNVDEQNNSKSSPGNLDGSLFGASSNTPIVTITPPNKAPLHRVSSVRSTSSYINSLKHRISNGSLFKYREETRAARISALVIVMGLICWTPYVVVLLTKNLAPITGQDFPHETDVAALSFLILAAYVSPLLFGYRSRRVKRELRKFFCFRKELSYKNNRSLMAKKVLKRRHSGNLSQLEMDARYNIFNCVYGRNRWPKDKVHFVQVPETALVVETCRSSFSSGASTQISSTSTEEC